MLEKLKGQRFGRAKMPEDAVSEDMRMLVLVDAANGSREGVVDGHVHT